MSYKESGIPELSEAEIAALEALKRKRASELESAEQGNYWERKLAEEKKARRNIESTFAKQSKLEAAARAADAEIAYDDDPWSGTGSSDAAFQQAKEQWRREGYATRFAEDESTLKPVEQVFVDGQSRPAIPDEFIYQVEDKLYENTTGDTDSIVLHYEDRLDTVDAGTDAYGYKTAAIDGRFKAPKDLYVKVSRLEDREGYNLKVLNTLDTVPFILQGQLVPHTAQKNGEEYTAYIYVPDEEANMPIGYLQDQIVRDNLELVVTSFTRGERTNYDYDPIAEREERMRRLGY